MQSPRREPGCLKGGRKLPEAMEQGEVNEAELRNKRAIYLLEQMCGTHVIDLGKVLNALRGHGEFA